MKMLNKIHISEENINIKYNIIIILLYYYIINYYIIILIVYIKNFYNMYINVIV